MADELGRAHFQRWFLGRKLEFSGKENCFIFAVPERRNQMSSLSSYFLPVVHLFEVLLSRAAADNAFPISISARGWLTGVLFETRYRAIAPRSVLCLNGSLCG
jgi:hypothetical protein